MQSSFDALIIGAGPAGSTAAILLSRAGWSVGLVERQSFPRRKVCGECIAASNLPLLHALGLGPAFEAAAGPELRQVVLMRGSRAVRADLPSRADPRHPWGRALGRETLDTLLIEQARLAGATVLQPCSVRAVEGFAGDWRMAVRAVDHGAALCLHAPVAIAAHGSWEALPAGRPQRRRARSASDLFAFKANFRGATLEAGLLPVLSFNGGYGGMVVADAGITTLACCIRRDRLDAARAAQPGARAGGVVEALLMRECAGVRKVLDAARRDGPWLAAGPIDPGISLSAGDGPFRIGNAAGEAHPIIGEGMSMAMQSAWLLCGQLLGADGFARPAAADLQREQALHYAAQWRRHFAPRLRLAAVFAHLAMRPMGAAALMALSRAWPPLLTLGASWGGKTRCAVEAELISLLSRAESRPAAPASASHFRSLARA